MPDTGAPWNLRYPDVTDLVVDGPEQFENLAEDVAAGLSAARGLVQTVVATDGTARTTSSTSFVDASISASITPQDASNLLVVTWVASTRSVYGESATRYSLQITDASNTALQGAENYGVDRGGATVLITVSEVLVGIGTVTAGSTSSRTYKGRFRRGLFNITLDNNLNTGMFIIQEWSV